MSSEMREIRAMADAVERDIALGKLDAPAVFTKMRDLLNLALLARTEAGPSLLCQSDACAHKGTVHNFCTPRTEAGADGDSATIWITEETRAQLDEYKHSQWPGYGQFCTHKFVGERGIGGYTVPLYTHPQAASGDAENARRYRWARDHVGGTAWNDDNFATVTIGVTVPKPRGTCAFDVTAEMLDAAIDAAMQAKEAK